MALGLVGLLHPSAARAEAYQFSSVELRSLGCAIDGLADAELRAAVASELSASSLALAPAEEPLAAGSVVVTVRLPCAPLTDLGLNANFAGIAFARTVNLDELPRASRARALALVLAELLTEFAEPELAEEKAQPDAAAAAPAEAAPSEPRKKMPDRAVARPPNTAVTSRPAASDDRFAGQNRGERGGSTTRARFGVGPEWRVFLGGPSMLGARVHADWNVFTIGVGALARDSTVSSGVLSALIVQSTGAARVLTLGRPDRTSLSLGPRVGLGYVTVTAQPLSPGVETHAAREPYIDGAVFADFGFHPLPSVRGGVVAELGYARGVVALSDTTDIGHYGGFFASALFDVAFEL
jgi:hypothetical protein